MLILPTRGPVDKIRALDVSNFAQSPMGVVPLRDLCREPPAPRAPTSDGSHVGLDPGFIDEDETGRINPRLIFFPTRAAARHVGAILLGRQHAFF